MSRVRSVCRACSVTGVATLFAGGVGELPSKPMSFAGPKKIGCVSRVSSITSLATPSVAPSRSICDRVSSISVFSSNKLNSPTNRPTKHCRLLANHCELLRTIIDHEPRVNQGYFELHRTTANHSAADTASATMGSLPTPTALRTSRQPAHCSIWSRLLTHKSSRISRRTPYVCCLAPAHAAAPA